VIHRPPCDEGVVRGRRESAPCPERDRPWVLVATILGSSLAFIDGTVVNVALPAVQRELGATVTDAQWVVEAYALFLSSLLLVGGSLGDHYGRRRVYAFGISLFALASLACGFASRIEWLIAARALQGVGAALLVPGSLAILSASFPENERGRAIGTWSGASAVTTAIGPVVGGWLIEHWSWRWAFFVNLPIAAVVVAILLTRVPESRDPGAARRLDWAGASLATIGLGGVVYALIESSHLGWGAPPVVMALVAGILGLVAFVIVESRVPGPMLPLGMFRSPVFAGANLLTLFLYGALGGALFFLPLDLIQVQHYSATAAGAVFLPFIIIMFLLSGWAGGLVDRVGSRLPLIVGPSIAAVGFALFARPGIGGSYWTTFFPAIVVLGFGMTVTVAPLTTTVMNAVPVDHSGVASGINNAVSRTAGLLALAVMSVIMLQVFDRELGRRLVNEHVSPSVGASLQEQRLKLGAAEAPPGASAEERTVAERIVAESFVAGFRATAWLAAALALASAAAAALLIGPVRRGVPAAAEART
jgi:EmrB/QacA subfamily drug resistance transporter